MSDGHELHLESGEAIFDFVRDDGTIVLEVAHSEGPQLAVVPTPQEARKLAQHLLADADRAEEFKVLRSGAPWERPT